MKQQRMMGEQDVVDALRFGKELPHLKDQFELLVEEINSLEDKRNSLRAAISALQNRISADCGRGNGLILKVRVSGPDLACDAIDLVSAAEYILRRIVKRAIFVVDLVDGRAPTRGVVFTEDVAKIADQQGRYAVGHDVSRIVGDYNYNCVSVSSALRLVCRQIKQLS
jgi:hypothetical protein